MSTKLILATLVAAASLAGSASAIDYAWLGTASDQWNDAANWNNGVPTTTGDGYTTIGAVTAPAKDPNIPAGQTGRVAGLNVNSGGHLYVSGTLTTGSSGTGYANIHAASIIDIYGTLDVTKNLYVGMDAGTATVNVRPGGKIVPHSGTTLTLGQGAAANIGSINIWGTVNFAALRWGYQNGTGRMTMYDDGTFAIPGNSQTFLQSKIDAGELKSGTKAHIPSVSWTVDPNVTTVRLIHAPYATAPAYTPALIGTSAQLNGATGTITLSWDNPIPSDGSRPVTNNVYFGLNDGTTLPQVAGGITANFVTVGIDKLKSYAWRVDSYDPNTSVTTTGFVWTFNTNNTAPTVTAETGPIWTWLAAGSLTLHATAADDGYPLPSSITYTWSQTDTTKDVLASPVTGQNVTLPFPYAMTFNFQVVASDGSATSTAWPVQVRVFSTPCAAAKDKSAAAVLPGDFNKDCTVNVVDLVIVINDWLRCTSADGVCP